MAGRALALITAAAVAALALGPLLVVAGSADAGAMRPADWAALRFTLVQAALSAAISCLLAVPVARALARRAFPGRGVVVALMTAPFILPVIVAVLGLVAVFGRAGAANAVLGWVGLPPVSIYGLSGVVTAHVFFNLPLAARLILAGWEAVPAERLRLAASLGAGPWATFRLIEWPLLRTVLPGALAVVFVICLTSFAVALTLGGGPRATTVELAIYEAFLFDFDTGRAARLALIQAALGLGAVGLGLLVPMPRLAGGLGRAPRRWGGGGKALDAVLIALAALFVAAPVVAVVLRGAVHVAALPPSVWVAAGNSLLTAAASAALCLLLALAIAIGGGRLEEGVGTTAIAISPLVIGTGLFLAVIPFVDPAELALPVTGMVNAVMALPFALRFLVPAARRIRATQGRLSASLGMERWTRLRIVTLPGMRREIGAAAGIAAALSMGDLGVIAFFADAERATLPLQMYRLMGAYRMDEAMGAAVLLTALAFGAFRLCDGWGARGAGRAWRVRRAAA
ncbi:thiamine transport system permease protein [Hasllibacter halocynthiae]|uniref:Thiamine transport system permease protein n=1 Tax=Hasllibacter halocynthiae TaxID=595589 RepID=A0A2T0X362_9RHOB|nr:ABC transporter permease subunit [Hasllibacter halocynthiae]PRY93389.1 thiamine transport system permease protein [Hasllibacter halocynthiae]